MIRRYGWIALVILVLDRVVKVLAQGLEEPFVLLPGLIRFTYTQNTGMAFSMFSGQSWVLGIISAAVIVIGYFVLRRYRLGTLASVSAMLILGGAVGNMIDRFFQGYVVDMFEVILFRFAVFNVADSALTVGCVLMGASLLLCPNDWREKTDGSN